MGGLSQFLQGVALRTSADVFRPKPVPTTGNADLSQDEVVDNEGLADATTD